MFVGEEEVQTSEETHEQESKDINLPKGNLSIEKDRVELVKRIGELQSELNQVRMEKEMYLNQVQSLEGYFKKVDEEVKVPKLPSLKEQTSTNATDEEKQSGSLLSNIIEDMLSEQEKKELLELKEKQKYLQHQLSIAQAERDGFRKLLSDLKQNSSQEAGRKQKAIDNARNEIFYLNKFQNFLKQLILNEYKNQPTQTKETSRPLSPPPVKNSPPISNNSSTSSTPQSTHRDKTEEDIDVHSILKLQTALEEQLVGSRVKNNAATSKVTLEQSNNQIKMLGKVLRGEHVSSSELPAFVNTTNKLQKAFSTNNASSATDGTDNTKQLQPSVSLGNTNGPDSNSFANSMKVFGKKIQINK